MHKSSCLPAPQIAAAAKTVAVLGIKTDAQVCLAACPACCVHRALVRVYFPAAPAVRLLSCCDFLVLGMITAIPWCTVVAAKREFAAAALHPALCRACMRGWLLDAAAALQPPPPLAPACHTQASQPAYYVPEYLQGVGVKIIPVPGTRCPPPALLLRCRPQGCCRLPQDEPHHTMPHRACPTAVLSAAPHPAPPASPRDDLPGSPAAPAPQGCNPGILSAIRLFP